jgi:pilus assembly protein Flp/PilA
MQAMRNAVRRFMRDEAGLEMVEWAVVGTAIVITAAAVFTPLGTAVANAMTAITTSITG